MKLTAPTNKPVVLAAIQANLGVEAEYRIQLQKLIKQMSDEFLAAIGEVWEDTPPLTVLAQDKSATELLGRLFRRLGRYWINRFDSMSVQIARMFANGATEHTDRAMRSALKKAGFTIEFKPTPESMEAYHATLAENVGLIKTIPQQYLKDVQTIVWKSVQSGHDLHTLTEALKNTYGITHRRAALIASDQNNKAKATIENVRRLQLGITQAIWRHSGAGKHPRPSHVKANGQTFDLAKGMYLDGEWVLPGQAINCLTGDSIIEFSAGCKKLWRRWYTGELTQLITASGEIINTTPNHPVLTSRGWIPIQDVDIGDYVVKIGDEVIDSPEANIESCVPSFKNIFDTISGYISASKSSSARFEFHGDMSDDEVDTIDIYRFLPSEIDSALSKIFCELFFTEAYHLLIGAGFQTDRALYATISRLFSAPESIVSGFCTLLPLLKGHLRHADDIGLRLSSNFNAAIDQSCANATSCSVIALRKLKLTDSSLIFGDDQFIGKLFGILASANRSWDFHTPSANSLGESISTNIEGCGSTFDGLPAGYEFNRVINKSGRKFSGHVYNLESDSNWYSSSYHIIHNCRCTSRAIIPSFED